MTTIKLDMPVKYRGDGGYALVKLYRSGDDIVLVAAEGTDRAVLNLNAGEARRLASHLIQMAEELKQQGETDNG
jgi:hypothetical protein